ncbi:helix-turn-helix domain-containing protein [Nocardia cyriacigeorgica]|uniref:Helix-turn-helix domain-containing protein n=1 Tax=Nocardia cyriacigeorgica TaxID=135487 RepID=A0A6P1CR25_9NOCA|nr:helix-turn-helix domain-containing protein [Nocardia cyriacigeorgica]MBF6285511.1 helix-turn-helix domain-containing protein [Nocardia cyriacigeorgica]NEW34357.1 helix-turn-helix domain-containing protein [Nocardia cyriacigeorgica]
MDVGVFVMDGVADFGLAALLETFNTANGARDQLETPPAPWRVRTLSFGDSVTSGHGHTIATTPLIDGVEPDMMIVPAVQVLDPDPLVELVTSARSKPVLERIRQVYEHGSHVAGACSGTFFLAEAGVLDGSSATTSWWLGPTFRRRYPQIALDESRILCRGPRVSTAGAALSHMYLALGLVQSVSPALAELTSRYLIAGSGRKQSDFVLPEIIARGNSVTAAFERWVRDHLAEQFLISTAAQAIGVTERSLQRATHAELGMSPRDFVNDIRLERAAHLLRTTDLTLDAVAARVGYLNAGTLRGLVKRRRGVSIAELRAAPLAW